MAFSTVTTREVPKFVLLTEYTVFRSGAAPGVRVVFEEMVYILDSPVTVTQAQDLDADGKAETLTIPEWGGRTDLLGKILALPDSTRIGVITAVDQVQVTEDVWEGAELVAPATYEAQVRVAMEIPTDLSDAQVALVKTMAGVSTPQYRRAVGGRRWELALDGFNPAALGKMVNMLGAVHVEAVLSVLQVLGISTVTPAQVVGAVQTLAANGTNIDGMLAKQGEKLEQDRQAGLMPWLIPAGDAP